MPLVMALADYHRFEVLQRQAMIYCEEHLHNRSAIPAATAGKARASETPEPQPESPILPLGSPAELLLSFQLLKPVSMPEVRTPGCDDHLDVPKPKGPAFPRLPALVRVVKKPADAKPKYRQSYRQALVTGL